MPGFPPGQRDPAHRIERRCDSCGQFDTHPRHIHLWDDGRMTIRHMDCCMTTGCPDGSCTDIVAGSGRQQGSGLVTWLHSPAFAQTAMAAAARGAPWAATAKATGTFDHPTLGR